MKTYILALIFCLAYASSMLGQIEKYRVHSIDGQFSVSPSGSATYSIPIKVPKGVKNMEPQISITYDSNAGNGLLGWGWNINTISKISCIPQNVYYDGENHKGFAYSLDGKRLIGSYYTYKLESDDFTTIQYIGGVPDEQYFIVTTQDNIKYYYNEKIQAKEANSNLGTNIEFLLSRVEDEYGNYISYIYDKDVTNFYAYLTEIIYGSNVNNETHINERRSIKFTYESRPDIIPFSFFPQKSYGFKENTGSITKRLKSISTRLDGYTFEYDTDNRSSLLTQIGKGQYNRPIVIDWWKRGQRSLEVNDFGWDTDALYSKSEDMMFFSADLNGDGISDLISLFKNEFPGSTGQFSYMIRYLSNKTPNGVKFTSSQSQIINNIDTGLFNDYPTVKNGPIRAAHLRAGTEEVLVYSKYSTNQFVGFFLYDQHTRDASIVEQKLIAGTELPLFTFMDVNNEGVERIVYLEKQSSGDNYYNGAIISCKGRGPGLPGTNDIYEVQDKISFKMRFRSTPLRMIPGDFDGDGLPDLLILFKDGYLIYKNQGKSYNYFDHSSLSVVEKSFNGDYFIIDTGDFNGDGLPDLILKQKYNSGYTLALNTGGKFTFRSLPNVTDQNENNSERYNSLLVYDFDNDGRSDVLISATSAGSGLGGGATRKKWYRSIGEDFELIKYTLFDDQNKAIASSNPNGKAIAAHFKNNLLGDFNGDGRIDLMVYGPLIYGGGTVVTQHLQPSDIKWRIYSEVKSVVQLGRVYKITDGYRRSIDIKYSNFNDLSANYSATTNSKYPVRDITALPIGLVDRVTYKDATGTEEVFTDYSYSGAKVHLQGKGFLGFTNLTSASGYNDAKGYTNISTTTQTFGLNTTYYAPFLAEETQKKGSNLISSVKNTYDALSLGDKRFNLLLKTQISKDEVNGNITTTSHSDFYKGMPKTTLVNYGGNISEETKIECNERGLPTKVSKLQKEGTSTWTTRTDIEYKSASSNEVMKKTDYVNGNSKVFTTKYEYDVWGNTTKETVNKYDSNNTLITKYGYTYDGRYLESKILPDGQIQAYFNRWDDKLTSVEDYYSGEETVYSKTYTGDQKVEYLVTTDKNGVRRKASEEYPIVAGKATGPYNSLYTITESGDNIPTTVGYYDGWGREIKTSETRFDGSKIFVDRVYDREGKLTKESLPYKTQVLGWNEYSYDSYGRLKELKQHTGKVESYSYGNNTETITKDGITTTRTVDPIGKLKKVVDPVGEINYEYRADGQISKIKTKEGIETAFTYDNYGRQLSIKDPSAGEQKYGYDEDGNIKSITTPKHTKLMEYDKFGRIVSRKEGDITTNYNYHPTLGDLTLIASSTGHKVEYLYGDMRRLLVEKESFEGNILQKNYTYSDKGLLLSTKYNITGKDIVTQNYQYVNGTLTRILLNGNKEIWSLKAENQFGQPIQAKTGNLDRLYGYDNYGMPTSRTVKTSTATIQDFGYAFDIKKGNLTSRTDKTRTKTESFGYDNMNRLTSFGGQTINYDNKGNVTQHSAVGVFDYNKSGRPYALTDITSLKTSYAPPKTQVIQYNAMERPEFIGENPYKVTLLYDSDGNRIKMTVKNNTINALVRYYLGGQYEKESGTLGNKEILFLDGDAYSASSAYVKTNNAWVLYYICRDYLGSITHITNETGTVLQELSYDAWGQLRDPKTHGVYAKEKQPNLILNRGYTGHEHLPWFGLVNMNARLYDPVVGRFLSPDPYVQMPDFSQNFNRYSYALNNPLRYTDENGEWIQFVIVPIAMGAFNVIMNHDNIHDFWQGVAYFGTGAISGLVGLGAPWAGGAILGFGNSITQQGFNNIDWGLVGLSTATSAVTFHLGGAVANKLYPYASRWFSSVGNDVVREGLVMGTTGAGSGLVVGGGVGYVTTGEVDGAIDGAWKGLALGFGTGFASGAGNQMYSNWANGKHLWTGEYKNIVPDSAMKNINPGGHAYSRGRNDNLGLSQKDIASKVRSTVNQYQDLLPLNSPGTNTVDLQGVINGIPKTIRVNINNGTMRSINLFDTTGNPRTSLIINIGNVKW